MLKEKIKALLKPYLTKELFIVLIASLCFLLFYQLSRASVIQTWTRQMFLEQIKKTKDFSTYLQYMSSFLFGFIFFFLVPFVYSLIFLRKDKAYFPSLKMVKNKVGMQLSLILLGFMMVVIVAGLFIFPDLSRYYPMVKYSTSSIGVFILFQASLFIYVSSWEYFCHGFLLFPFEQKFGAASILIGLVPFILLHIGKPFSEQLGSIIAGLALAILSRETRTFWYGAILHSTISIFMDSASFLFKLLH